MYHQPPGLTPSESNWQDSCTFELGPCEPSCSKTLLTTVKSQPIEYYSSDSNEGSSPVNNALRQTLSVKVKTSYYHGLYAKLEKNDNEAKPPSMGALLEAKVTTLERPALSLSDASAFSCGDNSIILNAVVHCNTPVPFSLKEWNLTLPPYLKLMKDGDLNQNLFQQTVAEGEELFFGFKCEWSGQWSNTEHETLPKPVLLVILQDNFSKTFRQVLPLNIEMLHSELERKNRMMNAEAVIVELMTPSQEGFVGAPISLQYNLDTSNLVSKKAIKYEISYLGTDWMVGGKIKGVISVSQRQKSPLTLDFVGIPTRQGVLNGYPSIFLSYISSEDQCESITSGIKVQARQPTEFLSLSYNNHTAIACPA